MKGFLKFFIPNTRLDERAVSMMLFCQLGALVAIWCVSPFVFLPKPLEVVSGFEDMWNQGLAVQLITSLMLNMEAILVSSVLSLILSYLVTIQFFRPWIAAFGKLRFLSMIGLSFFFVLMTRSGHELKLSLLVFSVSVFFTTGMVDVVMSIPKEQYDLARVMHMNQWEALWEVVVLGQIDKAFDVLRQNAAMGWMMLSFVESYDRSDGGVGAMLATQGKYFHLPEIFAIQITILVLGLAQDYAIGLIKRAMCPYAELVLEAR